jgi:hypothetical protein
LLLKGQQLSLKLLWHSSQPKGAEQLTQVIILSLQLCDLLLQRLVLLLGYRAAAGRIRCMCTIQTLF